MTSDPAGAVRLRMGIDMPPGPGLITRHADGTTARYGDDLNLSGWPGIVVATLRHGDYLNTAVPAEEPVASGGYLQARHPDAGRRLMVAGPAGAVVDAATICLCAQPRGKSE